MVKARHRLVWFALLGLLTACAHYDPNWAPIVDVASDQHADRLKSDTDQCRQLALRAGKEDVGLKTRGTFMDDDGDIVSKPVFEHAFSTCLKLRKHPVLN